MARRGDICSCFNHIYFRYLLRTKYKTDKTFAKRIGVHPNTITAWKQGARKPTWWHVVQMAKAFNVAPRELIHKKYQVVLDKWEDHLMDYLMAPPEVKQQTKKEITLGDGEGNMDKQSETITKREQKLSERGAIELTEKLGIFDGIDIHDDDEDVKSVDDLFKGLKNDAGNTS